MSQFGEYNAENKLRIPLSAYAAQIIENDCFSFSKKKTTLINAVIVNSYLTAECSISLRLKELRAELTSFLNNSNRNSEIELIDHIIEGKAKQLTNKYAKRHHSDVNWQITLTKKTKELLTIDPYSAEEQYYGPKPGHYVRALLEEYARKPYYSREKIIFKSIFEAANIAIDSCYFLNISNINGNHYLIKPHSIKTDPLSMFHYLVGIRITPLYDNDKNYKPEVISFRISRITNAEPQYLSSGKISKTELKILNYELETKGVQFVTSDKQSIKVWLSDTGIKRYQSQAHLRPPVISKDPTNEHIFNFECTDAQILFYFWEFGNEALIIDPPILANTFMERYKEAYNSYKQLPFLEQPQLEDSK